MARPATLTTSRAKPARLARIVLDAGLVTSLAVVVVMMGDGHRGDPGTIGDRDGEFDGAHDADADADAIDGAQITEASFDPLGPDGCVPRHTRRSTGVGGTAAVRR